MIVESIRIKNFRSLKDLTVDCDSLTALVGPNGGGKSSVLRALELFYSPSPRVEVEDFYDRDTSEDVEVELTFTQLGEDAREKFAPYLQGDELTVVRVFSLREERSLPRFYGSRLQNPAFASVRSAANAANARAEYNALTQTAEYNLLPSWRSQSTAQTTLRHWEEANPERCVRQRDDGQFFGFAEVAQGYLGRFTKLISIPAVRDAIEESGEGRGRALSELMDLVVRNRLASRDSIAQLRTETHEKYDEILLDAQEDTDDLASQISSRLDNYVPGATVKLSLDSSGAVAIELPKARARLVEDGYETDVSRTGHGLQRAFIIAMLQELAAAQVGASSAGHEADEGDQSGPNIILALEEPELYQHPSRQRRLASILSQLSQGSIPGLTERIQVLYVTHSPLFTGLDRFDQLRMLRKVESGPGRPRATRVTQVRGDAVAEAVWEACDRRHGGAPVGKFTWSTLRPRLQAIMTPWMAEGFFADIVVLVEGSDDRAAVLGAAHVRGKDLEHLGYAVIPCGGKSSIDRPAIVFQKFGIPTFLLWDSDKGDKRAKPEENHRLLRIVGATVEDYPAVTGDNHACFEDNLEDTVRREIGEEMFDDLLDDCRDEFELGQRKDAIKNPFVFGQILRRAADRGRTSVTLESVVDSILTLKGI